MRIGYPCINRSIGCRANKTFRLKSYSENRLIETVAGNLECLEKILCYNIQNDILFFRITSDLVPFASHPVCTLKWQNYFHKRFREIGNVISRHGVRISMHPDQFILLNSPDDGVTERSIKELAYHAEVLDLMELDQTAKIQLHAGGVYGDKEKSIARFIRRYNVLDATIRHRLVIENDDKLYDLADCLRISANTGIPVILDTFHHEVNNSGQSLNQAVASTSATWGTRDGLPLLDYSSQHPDGVKGRHAETIDTDHFQRFLSATRPHEFDVMLEIKDKELSARKAVSIARNDKRFVRSEIPVDEDASVRVRD